MVLLFLLVIGLVAGLGFVVGWLFVAAGGLFILWTLGFLLRSRGARWYRW